MIRYIPSTRLIVWVAFFLPFTIFTGLYPVIIKMIFGWLLFIIILSVIDLIISHKRIEYLDIIVPSGICVVQNKTKVFDIKIKNLSKYNLKIRIAFDGDRELEITPEEINLGLGKYSEYMVPVTLESKVRGKKRIEDICIEVRSLLDFWAARAKKPVNLAIKVYPNIFQNNQRLAASLLLRSEFGIHSRRVIGHGREFEQLREYMPDDNYSDISWKATAKKGMPITKVFQLERIQQIYIALDYSRTSYFMYDKNPNLDIALESVLLLQLCCEREGDILGLITFEDRVSRYCPAGKGKAHFGVLRDMLYDLTPKNVTPDYESLFIFLKQHVKKRALVLLFTNLEDPGIAENFFNDVKIINRTHLVTLCTFNGFENKLLFTQGGVGDLFGIYKKLAAQLSNNEQEKLASRLKKQNVDMLRFRPDQFSIGVIEHYLSIKRRQVL